MKITSLLCIICVCLKMQSIHCVYDDFLQSFLTFLLDYNEGEAAERLDDKKDLKIAQFDFIIVGAGSAGCALAARLSENPNWKVLLLEAGGPESYLMDIPGFVNFWQLNNQVNWGYKTMSSNSSCLAMKNNRCHWPRGRVMGGSSVLNYMIYTRGNRRDFDSWAAMGNPGWSYNEVLPYFMKLEKSTVKNRTPNWHGKDGPINVSDNPWKSKSAMHFVKAAKELGIPYVDYNGPTQIGVSYMQTTTKDGARLSSNVGYLYPIKRRKNLFIRKMRQVTKVLIDPNTKVAYGVQYSKNGKTKTVYASKEVILSAGAINSPQLLMLSGVGPADHLRKMNIPPIVDLPVGHNLMDHTAAGALTITVNVTTLGKNVLGLKDFVDFQNGKGKLTSTGGCESIVFLDSKNQNDLDAWPDIELLQVGGSIYAFDQLKESFNFRDDLIDQMFGDLIARQTNAFMVFPMVLQPKSRGRILLKNKNPFTYPKIYANYFTDPEGHDIRVSVNGIKKLIEILEMPSMRQINAQLHKTPVPACRHLGFGTDEYWACYTRYFTFTIYHYSGTAKMGPANDPTAVVDPRLRVYGIGNLRVVDASIMPTIVAGHPNAAIYMIAEKAADMIKEDWNKYV